MLLYIDSEYYITLETFLKINTEPDVQPLSEKDILALRSLKEGENYTINNGAGGTTLVEAISDLDNDGIPNVLKPSMVVVVEGGVVQSIFSNIPIAVTLVDWDNIKEGDEPTPYRVNVVTPKRINDLIQEAYDKTEELHE
jgi:hypothetical protein